VTTPAVNVKSASGPDRSGPAARAWQRLSESAQHGFAREALLVALAIVAYFAIRNATAGGAEQASANAGRILRLEDWAGVAWEQRVQGAIVGHDVLVTLTNWVYIWGHWPVVLGVATALYLYRRDRYYLLRNALFASGAIGFLFFAFFPVAPPRLVDPAFVDTVTNESSSYRALQPPGLTNQYAAFPSLHLGFNVVVGIVLFLAATHLAVRLFAVVGPVVMGFAVVATANHFLLDVVGGLCVVAIGLAVAFSLERRNAAATLDRRECSLDDH
jgi:membrane-associated phospholipid phosphatase